MNSFFGKMLFVDLSTKKTEIRDIPTEWVELYTGQKGLGTRILMEDFPVKTDPLSPENRIVLSTSIMAGTIVSSSSKLAMVTKSPHTKTISDGSVGGHIGAELKYTGYDAVLITGKSDELSYLYIDPDKAEIRPASNLKGIGTFETETRLKEMVGDGQVKILSIGPAGEHLVPFSCVCSERYRQLGRGGIGAVMGSKNLKAIAIRGWLDVHVPDIEECMKVVTEIHSKGGITDPENPIYVEGTPCLVALAQESGLLPTRNFQKGTFSEAEKISSDVFTKIRRNKKACFSCTIACGNYVKTGNAEVEGPEYETIALCGACIGNGDPDKIVQFNATCDDLGMDTISAGGTIAFMMEMTEKGIHDFGIRFGETDNALRLLKQIAFREGMGAEAALGTKALSEKCGGNSFAMQIKGLELPGYDPRGSWGMGIAYATAPRGGCHMSAYPIEYEAWGELEPFTYKDKAQLVVKLQNAQFAKFSMGVCDFWPIGSDTLGRLFEITYGGKWPRERVNKVGERIFNLQRMFNVMAGFTRKDDKLPERLHKEVLKDGAPKGIVMPKDAFEKAMDEYFSCRSWDEQGRPTIEKLKELNIEKKLIDEYKKALNG
jgi:aldehyde:ferredoxin oxidoreductase